MKAFVIILSVACVGLAYGLYQSNSSAGREATAAETQLKAFTNQVDELKTKLMMTQGDANHAQSNLQYLVNLRVGDLANTSNRLVQLNLLYRAAQTEARTAQSELQSLAGKLAVLEAERDGLQRGLAAVPVLERRVVEMRDKLASAVSERNSLLQELGKLEVDKADLQRKLEDIGFLRTQLARVEENAALLRRLAKAGHSAALDSKARLELLDDGTVRPAIPTTVGHPK
jgi:chromosome segregation ATPase